MPTGKGEIKKLILKLTLYNWPGQNLIGGCDKPLYQENGHIFLSVLKYTAYQENQACQNTRESINLAIERFKVLNLVKKGTCAEFFNCICLFNMNLAGLIKEGSKSNSSRIFLLSYQVCNYYRLPSSTLYKGPSCF